MEQSEKQILERMLGTSPWFTAARYSTTDDAETLILAAYRSVRKETFRDIDRHALTHETDNSIIDRFLKCESLRVVAADDSSDSVAQDVRTEALIDSDDDIASEALAEIYLAQGMTDKAIETYERLCLLFPEKNIYFAGRITQIKQEKI